MIMILEDLLAPCDVMKNTAKITHFGSNSLTSEQVQDMLSIQNLPQSDVAQGNTRYYHNLKADTKIVAELVDGCPSGSKLYPTGGFLQWHTNSNNEGFRVYLSYVNEAGAWFRFVKNGQEI